MLILAIESSCDETAVAVVRNGHEVLSNTIASQADLHKKTGGVVPEVAAREHIVQIIPVLDESLKASDVRLDDIDAFAATTRPGLVSSLLIGAITAKTLSELHQKPLIQVHHIAGHIYSNFLEREPTDICFPFLVLTVSGGHNQLILVRNHHDFEVLGDTLDDAAGEAFDKAARLLGLGYPGGPAIEKIAKHGDHTACPLPIPMEKSNDYRFSFSGLKTALYYHVRDKKLSEQDIANAAAAFQHSVCESLSRKVKKAVTEYDIQELHLAGGVSANTALRERMQSIADNHDIVFRAPLSMRYCTDNAAMIGAAAFFQKESPTELIVTPDASFA